MAVVSALHRQVIRARGMTDAPRQLEKRAAAFGAAISPRRRSRLAGEIPVRPVSRYAPSVRGGGDA